MPYTPRADEIAPIVALIESDEFEDAKSMAREILRQAARIVADREVWAIFPSSGVVGHGIFFSAKDAERAWGKGIGETYGSQGRLLRVRPFDPTETERGGTCECLHSKDLHQDKGKCCAYYVGATGPKASVRPNLPRCACTGFTQRKV